MASEGHSQSLSSEGELTQAWILVSCRLCLSFSTFSVTRTQK